MAKGSITVQGKWLILRENEGVGPRQGNQRGPTFHHMPMTGGTVDRDKDVAKGCPCLLTYRRLAGETAI